MMRHPSVSLSLATPAHADPDLSSMRVELKRHDPAVQRVNTTPLQATDSVILLGCNGAFALTVGGESCYLPHRWQAGTGIARLALMMELNFEYGAEL